MNAQNRLDVQQDMKLKSLIPGKTFLLYLTQKISEHHHPSLCIVSRLFVIMYVSSNSGNLKRTDRYI